MIDWTERLSDYLDGDMSGEERSRLEAALGADAELRRVLEDIREVKQTAGSLPPSSPRSDLWPGIALRIEAGEERTLLPIRGAGHERRRISFTLPQLAAAAVALMVLGSTSVWMAMSARAGGHEGGSPTIAVAPAPEAGFVSVSPEADPDLSYETAIRDLEAQLEIGRDRLDPGTVEALKRSLATIDRAIDRAEEALVADPASVYLNRHLAEARTGKIRVLQQAALVASS